MLRRPASGLHRSTSIPPSVISLPEQPSIVQHLAIAPLPVLPQLQCGKQDDEAAERGVPEAQATAGRVIKDVRRCDQPEAEQELRGFFLALQHYVFEFGDEENQYADRHRIPHRDATDVSVTGRPRRQRNGKAEQHSEPVFPGSMSVEKTGDEHRSLHR